MPEGETLQPGDLVEFHTPSPDDHIGPMTVIEDRDDRVLVQPSGFGDWAIKPTTVYKKADLKRVAAQGSA